MPLLSLGYTDIVSFPTGKLAGRSTAGTGALEAITVGSGLTLSGGELTASGASLTDAVILAPDSDTRNVIQPTASTVKALVLKGAASQSDNLLEFQNSSGTARAWFNSDGTTLSFVGGDGSGQGISWQSGVNYISQAYGNALNIGNNLLIAGNVRISDGKEIHGYDGATPVTTTIRGANSSAGPSTLNIAGGSVAGSAVNVAGGQLVIKAGRSSGNATPATITFQAGTVGSSGATLQTLSTVLTITDAATITLADAVNIALNTTTGTKIGTATGQKLGFWNATPVVQQVLATGAGASADDIISLLQTLGLCKQS